MAKCQFPDCVHGFVHTRNILDKNGKKSHRRYMICPRCHGTGIESCCEGPISCEKETK